MTHKFAGRWTNHLPDDDGGLERSGTMDLSTMLANGRLDNGQYRLATGGVRRLEGQAVGNSIILREFDGDILRNTYEGQLGHESRNAMVIVGIKHAETTAERSTESATQQNDGPWVITKP